MTRFFKHPVFPKLATAEQAQINQHELDFSLFESVLEHRDENQAVNTKYFQLAQY